MRTDQLSNHDKELMDSFFENEDQILEMQEKAKPSMTEIEAINHIISVIDERGLDKCTDKTQDAYKVLTELSEKLSTDFVLYRP
tara:strand:+ start:2398 stop:2649 length:252 start_codon:yes stop_codon:yes gene_type:complete